MSGSDSAPVLPVAESPSELASIPAKSGTRLRGGKDDGASNSVDEDAIVAKMYIEPVFDKGTSDAEDGSSCSSSKSSSSGFVMVESKSSAPSLRSRASDCDGQRSSPVISMKLTRIWPVIVSRSCKCSPSANRLPYVRRPGIIFSGCSFS